MKHLLSFSIVLGCLGFTGLAAAATRTVGPGKTYAKPCAAFAAAADGDVIEIDASGNYDGDVCAIAKNNLTIKGVGGRAKVDAAGKNSGGKAIWVVQGNDTTIEDVELSGCTVPDGNGAGIRQEGKNLTLRRVFLHDNENGILTGANADSVIVFEDSEFARNGKGDGLTHNMYIGEIKSFTLRGSYSHHAKIGHLVKSRALENRILYNRLTDETGTASYEIDLPQGGRSFVIGNVLQQSATTDNPAFISFARESKRNPNTMLFAVNNTFFNARSSGTFVAAASGTGPSITLRNNIFAGPGTPCDQSTATLDTNFVGDPQFVNAAAYDFHLKAGSPALDKGAAPGTGDGESLVPTCQYVHPTHAVVRTSVGVIDQGGYELGGEGTTPCGGSTIPTDAGVPDGGGTTDGGGASDSGGATDSGSTTGDAAVLTDGATADDGGATTDAPTEDSSGCGCRTSGRGTGPGALAAVLALVFAARRRRFMA